MKSRTPASWLRPEPLLAVILWGGVYPGAKLALREIPAPSVLSLRLVFATFALFVVSGLFAPRRERPSWSCLLPAGLAQTAFQVCLVAGLSRTTAGNSAVLLATAPLLAAGWLVLTRRAVMGARRWTGLLLALVGVGVMVQNSVEVSGSRLSGDLLALGAAAAWAWYGLAIGPLVESVGTRVATAWTMLLAAAVVVPLSAGELLRMPWGTVSWPAWIGLLYGATAGMVLAMSLWGRAIHTLGPRDTMIYLYLEPVSAVVIAALLLGESMSLSQGIGALVVLGGVWLAS